MDELIANVFSQFVIMMAPFVGQLRAATRQWYIVTVSTTITRVFGSFYLELYVTTCSETKKELRQCSYVSVNLILRFSASMVIVCLANVYFILVLLPLMALIGFFVIFYLRTSVEMRRLGAMGEWEERDSLSQTPRVVAATTKLNPPFPCREKPSDESPLYNTQWYQYHKGV